LNAVALAGSGNLAESNRPVTAPCAGITVWFTGLSGSGKTTLAAAVAERLDELGIATVVLDGDVLRQSLSAGLGYSWEDRMENVRRLAELAARIASDGRTVLVAAIAPYRDARLSARQRLGRFVEVYVNAPLPVCIERDPKGLYARAIAGELTHFTGIDDPYEEPLAPEVECRTDLDTVPTCVASILSAIVSLQQQQPAP
jgi:adenylylsulfate kinase